MKADFSRIIRESVQITKTNKKLWVFGLVLATLTAGGNFGSGGGSDFKSEEGKNNQQNNTIERPVKQPELLNSNLLTSNMPQVLGTATSTISEVVKTIPPTFYAALIILIILAISLGVGISVYGRAWAKSGLIHGIDKQNSGESLGLYQMSDHGKRNAVEMIKISIIPGLLFGLAILGSLLILLIPLLLLGDAGKVIIIPLGILWVLAVIVAGIIIGGSVGLGTLAINLESLKWKDAFKRGRGIFRKYFIDVAVMSIINCFSGCIAGIATILGIAVLGGIGAASVVGAVALPPLVVLAGPVVFLAILAIIMLTGLINTVFMVFNQSTWVLLYKQLTEETSGQQ